MFVSTVSNSKHSLYFQCKLAYKYRYHDRYVGTPKNELALNFGSYIHKILEDGVNAKHISELQDLAETHKATYKIPNHYRDRTEICLRNFLKWNSQLSETVGTEIKYEVDLAKGITVNGIIDRVIKGKDGGVLIIDYKTSKREKTQMDLFFDKQLQGYAYAIHKELGVPLDKIVCAHYYPVTNNFVSVHFGRKRIGIWQNKMVEDVWRMRKAKVADLCPSENQFCNWCDYREVCPLHEKDAGQIRKRLDEMTKRPTRRSKS